ncbi:peptidoglycan-binding domain-containing protein [Bombiscardovia coagulans]|uniref:Peptidoglycan-binding protein n=1 Tax=Bombiscardovia coagulans TaxID=686666 RepID=A0A261EPI2_9BIFI|nr:peptidoglycan-binding domain-containing protein [Bombiscardovia coagulans]OZG48768.1 peptidoglycan-binding protein [Bombiscardovia coagulans]
MATRILTPLVLTACTALAVGVCATAFLMPTPTPQGLEESHSPSRTPTSIQKFYDERTLEVTPVTSPAENLTARTGGTVTETLCKPGAAITSGTKVLSVDSRPLIALHTDTPIYRELKGGERGPDVLALQQELRRLGYPAEGNGIYGPITIRGVKALMRASAAVDSDGSIKPGDTIWMPTTTVTPTQCLVGLNTTLNEGDEVMKTGGRLTGLTYQVLADLREGDRVFSVFDQKIVLPVLDGHINDLVFLKAIEESEAYRIWKADPAKKPKATLALAQPIEAIKVPPAAIFSQKGNKACVSTDGAKATPVVIVGSSLGSTLIQAQRVRTKIDQVYLGQALGGISCPA